ncbi:hypothetical protein ACH495_28745 [Micromonospora sp. NPDC018662]|uniref:hypothetical protein n=1 Tax=Micromonospora sp. NPDC018662 TaxID=3364238 RepID=UPI0037B3EB75
MGSVAVGLAVNLFVNESASSTSVLFLVSVVFAAALSRIIFVTPPSRGLKPDSTGLPSSIDTENGIGEADQLGVGAPHMSPELFNQYRVVRGIQVVEEAASGILDLRLTSRRLSLFSLRAGLVEAGLWNDEDIKAFDQVLSIRNSIAHGDKRSYSLEELESAAERIEQLGEGLRVRTAHLQDSAQNQEIQGVSITENLREYVSGAEIVDVEEAEPQAETATQTVSTVRALWLAVVLITAALIGSIAGLIAITGGQSLAGTLITAGGVFAGIATLALAILNATRQ